MNVRYKSPRLTWPAGISRLGSAWLRGVNWAPDDLPAMLPHVSTLSTSTEFCYQAHIIDDCRTDKKQNSLQYGAISILSKPKKHDERSSRIKLPPTI